MKTLFSNNYVSMFLAICLIEPNGLSNIYDWFEDFYRILKYIPYFFSIVMFLQIKHKSSMLYLILIYALTIIVSSVANGNISKGTFFHVGSLVCISIIAEYYITKGLYKVFINTFFLFLFVLFVVNLITILLYPDGMYVNEKGWRDNYFLGFKNDHVYYYITCLLLLYLRQMIAKNSVGISFYILLLSMFLSCLFVKSTTSSLVIFVFSLMVVFARKVIIPDWLNVRTVFIISFIISVLFIWGTIDGRLDSSELSEMAGKESDSVAVRSFIWIEAVISILKHPFIGVGDVVIDIGDFIEYGHAHNHYLDILLVGGVFLFIIFLCQIHVVSNQVKSIKSHFIRNIFLFIFVCYSIEYLAEAKRYSVLWIMVLMIAYHIPKLVNNPPKRTIHYENYRSNTCSI